MPAGRPNWVVGCGTVRRDLNSIRRDRDVPLPGAFQALWQQYVHLVEAVMFDDFHLRNDGGQFFESRSRPHDHVHIEILAYERAHQARTHETGTEEHLRRIDGHAKLWSLAAILGRQTKATPQPSKEKLA
jgi:hypothetical protein